MRLKKLASVFLFAFANLSFAAEFSTAPLLDSTRIVAGDLNHNEFFVLSDNDSFNQIKVVQSNPNKKPIQKIAKTFHQNQLAANKTFANQSNKKYFALKHHSISIHV